MEKRTLQTMVNGQCIVTGSSMVKKTKDPRERKTRSGFTVFCSAEHLALRSTLNEKEFFVECGAAVFLHFLSHAHRRHAWIFHC
jgi:hypothetical protein